MIVDKLRIFKPKLKSEFVAERGGGIVEVLLALILITVATPFTYSMISETTHMMHNMAIANDISCVNHAFLLEAIRNTPASLQIEE